VTQVVLLGTGSGGGWPNPFCTCASCTAAREAGVLRGQTSALVDDVLLLDCGAEVPAAAERAGRSLAGVRYILLTHAHVDHTAPAALLWRSWAGRREPVDVVGPEAAVDPWRDWGGPDDRVRFRPVVAGDVVSVGEYEVRVLAARHGGGVLGEAVLYDLSSPDGHRLLYATDTGPLPDSTLATCSGAAYDVVLLEETYGDWAGADPAAGHLDLTTFPRQLAALRRSGAITEATDVVAIHLSHRNPPPAELDRRLAGWGARSVPDGTVLTVGEPPERRRPRRVLVLGGARSGKSNEAERRLAAEPDVVYVATSGDRPDDPEWVARVAAHRARRPPYWRTLECSAPAGVVEAVRGARGPMLIDCLTLWLTAAMDEHKVWAGGSVEPVAAAIDELVAAWRATAAQVVAVSNEVGSGIVPDSAGARLFRDLLGQLNARIAAESDEVLLMVAGRAVRL
jgi:adenosylcobinamide kinase/adenosylcobinamide-phosphate guanylyltransferase